MIHDDWLIEVSGLIIANTAFVLLNLEYQSNRLLVLIIWYRNLKLNIGLANAFDSSIVILTHSVYFNQLYSEPCYF